MCGSVLAAWEAVLRQSRRGAVPARGSTASHTAPYSPIVILPPAVPALPKLCDRCDLSVHLSLSAYIRDIHMQIHGSLEHMGPSKYLLFSVRSYSINLDCTTTHQATTADVHFDPSGINSV